MIKWRYRLVDMENRYKLPSGVQRNYLQEVERVSELKGDNLAKMLGVVGRSYRDWKREKFPITQKAAEVIEETYKIKLPFSKEEALKSWRQTKLEASRKGGLALIQQYGGFGTLKGRIKGGRKAMAILRARGLVPQPKLLLLQKDIYRSLRSLWAYF